MTQLDVRTIPPRDRHPMIFNTFDNLQPGEAFELVNDHAPTPLYYQFLHERADLFEWEYLEQGPETWHVRITRK
jgi:uncharacterized protein (DUF2249 family)